MGKPTLNALTRGRLVAHPHDHVLRWRVKSLSRPEIEHVVDLDAWAGNGACSCEHFEFRLAPLLRDGATRGGAATRCGHIMVARDAFTNHMIQILSARAAAMESDQSESCDKSQPTKTQPCPECGGEAEIDGDPCHLCGGSGAVPCD